MNLGWHFPRHPGELDLPVQLGHFWEEVQTDNSFFSMTGDLEASQVLVLKSRVNLKVQREGRILNFVNVWVPSVCARSPSRHKSSLAASPITKIIKPKKGKERACRASGKDYCLSA